jgi:hypothetical protein
MYDGHYIQSLVNEICTGRGCSECPINGFCLRESWGDDPNYQEKIIHVYDKLFAFTTVTEDEIMNLFTGEP